MLHNHGSPDHNKHQLLDEISKINFTKLDVNQINTKTKKSILEDKIEKLKALGITIAATEDNGTLVNEFNAKLSVAYNQIRFIEKELGLASNALAALTVVKMKINNINPPTPKAELPIEPVAVKIIPPKPTVYTPLGMFVTFKSLASELHVKDHQAKTKNLVTDRRALNAGRADRRRPPDKVHPMDEPDNRKLDINALERELKNVDKFIAALADLKVNQPSSDADSYENFIMRYNKFAGGINHHLKGMLKAAMQIENTEELQSKIREKMQPVIARVVSAMTEERVEVAAGRPLPAAHQELLRIGEEIRNTNDLVTARTLSANLTMQIASMDFDINAQDSDGNTILHKAIENGYKGLVSALVNNSRHTPDINLENNNDETPIQLARRLMQEEKRDREEYLNNNPSTDRTKSTPRSAQIYDLVNPTTRRQTAQMKRLTQINNMEYENDLNLAQTFTKKYLNNFTKINSNSGRLEPMHLLFIAVNTNYKHHHKDQNKEHSIHKEFAKPELSKLLNPLLAINTVLSLINLGVKILIDKVCNKIVNKGPNDNTSTPVATVLKSIFTFPIAAVQLIVGGAGDLISYGINKIVDAAKGRQPVSTPTEVAADVNSLDFEPLGDAPRAGRDSKYIMAATKSTAPISEHKSPPTKKAEVVPAAPLQEQPQHKESDTPTPVKEDSFRPR